MIKSDQSVVIIMGLLILLYLSVWAVSYFTGKLFYFMSILNLASAAAIILYWTVRQLKIQQHTIELRDIVVLGAELIVIACAVYVIAAGNKFNWLKVVQYILFAIHFLLLLLALIFMLTFKMNRLI